MDREEGIRIIAYQIWEEEGCCHGSHVQHWLKAETIWQKRNALASTVKEMEPSVRNQKINTAVKTKAAADLNPPQSKKSESSKRKR